MQRGKTDAIFAFLTMEKISLITYFKIAKWNYEYFSIHLFIYNNNEVIKPTFFCQNPPFFNSENFWVYKPPFKERVVYQGAGQMIVSRSQTAIARRTRLVGLLINGLQ